MFWTVLPNSLRLQIASRCQQNKNYSWSKRKKSRIVAAIYPVKCLSVLQSPRFFLFQNWCLVSFAETILSWLTWLILWFETLWQITHAQRSDSEDSLTKWNFSDGAVFPSPFIVIMNYARRRAITTANRNRGVKHYLVKELDFRIERSFTMIHFMNFVSFWLVSNRMDDVNNHFYCVQPKRSLFCIKLLFLIEKNVIIEAISVWFVFVRRVQLTTM